MREPPRISVFVKLLGLFGVSFVFVFGGAIGIHLLSSAVPNIDVSLVNVEYYTAGLIAEIGEPPSVGRAAEIAERTGLDIAIIGPGVRWSNDEGLLEKAAEIGTGGTDSLLRFRELGDWIVRIPGGPYQFYFSEFHSDARFSATISILMIAVIILALGFSYATVRLLLKPIREMDAVAQEFGVSDWKRRVRVTGNDELAALGTTMNAMADRIESYIESMSGLIAAISHEFRSPLTRMKLSLEFIEDPKLRESLNEEIVALDRITETLLEQRRLDAGAEGVLKREWVKLQEWTDGLRGPYEHLAVPVRWKASFDGEAVFIDRGRMDLAVRNLIENALKHAPESPIRIEIMAKAKTVLIEVSDEGPGMAPRLLARIGEPFMLGDPSRTGSRKNGGYGLGLSMVRAIVEAHGGSLTAENRSPRGFSIRIELPR